MRATQRKIDKPSGAYNRPPNRLVSDWRSCLGICVPESVGTIVERRKSISGRKSSCQTNSW